MVVLSLIRVVGVNQSIALNIHLRIDDLDGPAQASWQRLNTCNQRLLIHVVAPLVQVQSIVSNVLFPWLFVPRRNRVEELLRFSDDVVPSYFSFCNIATTAQ